MWWLCFDGTCFSFSGDPSEYSAASSLSQTTTLIFLSSLLLLVVNAVWSLSISTVVFSFTSHPVRPSSRVLYGLVGWCCEISFQPIDLLYFDIKLNHPKVLTTGETKTTVFNSLRYRFVRNDPLDDFAWPKITFWDVVHKHSCYTSETQNDSFKNSRESVNLLEADCQIEREQQMQLLKLRGHNLSVPQRVNQ